METRRLGTQELVLPNHMSALHQDAIDFLVRLPDRNKRVLACGVDPRDNSLTLVTFNLEVRSLKPNGRLIPASAVPSGDGRFMGLTFRGDESIKTVSSAIAITYSEICLRSASLHVNDNYMSDLEIDSVVHVDRSTDDEDKTE